MKLVKMLALVCGLGLAFSFGAAQEAKAGYYSSWSYYPSYGYYYSSYTYAPQQYHYCVYYPSTPRYVYYYNPYQRQYWGRFDLQGKPGAQYSELAEKDKKGTLKEIPEEAFPAPGAMPKNPNNVDGAIPAPPKPPAEAPKGK